jgi:hypothetical protein
MYGFTKLLVGYYEAFIVAIKTLKGAKIAAI